MRLVDVWFVQDRNGGVDVMSMICRECDNLAKSIGLLDFSLICYDVEQDENFVACPSYSGMLDALVSGRVEQFIVF